MTGERRAQALTKGDIEAIVLALREADHTQGCRFLDITHEDLEAAVRFYKNFNAIIEDSKSTVRKTVLTAAVLFILGLIGAGTFFKITAGLPKG